MLGTASEENPLTLFFFFLYALFGTDIFIENTATRESSKQGLDYLLVNGNGEIR